LLEALSSNFENLDGLKPAFAQGYYARKSLSPRSMSEASRQMSLLDVAARGFGGKLLKKSPGLYRALKIPGDVDRPSA